MSAADCMACTIERKQICTIERKQIEARISGGEPRIDRCPVHGPELTPETIGELHWEDRKGAGRMLRGPVGELAGRLRTLRSKAVLRVPGLKEPVIGGCEKADGQDDQRIKWNWWCDADATRSA